MITLLIILGLVLAGLFFMSIHPISHVKQINETYARLHFELHQASSLEELETVSKKIEEFTYRIQGHISKPRASLIIAKLHEHVNEKWWSLAINEDHVVIPQDYCKESN